MEEKSGADAGEGEGLENEGGRIEYRSSSNAEKEAHGAVLVQLQQLLTIAATRIIVIVVGGDPLYVG